MIAAIALSAFFVASGLLAVAAIALTWRRYAAEFRSVRAGLRVMDEFGEFNVRVALTETHEFLPVARRSAIRPQAGFRQQLRHAQRAAA